jgi:hypothetical protein
MGVLEVDSRVAYDIRRQGLRAGICCQLELGVNGYSEVRDAGIGTSISSPISNLA